MSVICKHLLLGYLKFNRCKCNRFLSCLHLQGLCCARHYSIDIITCVLLRKHANKWLILQYWDYAAAIIDYIYIDYIYVTVLTHQFRQYNVFITVRTYHANTDIAVNTFQYMHCSNNIAVQTSQHWHYSTDITDIMILIVF